MIAGIIHEISKARGPISLHRITAVPLEKMFGVTRLSARTHSVLSELIEIMEVDQAMKIVYANRTVRLRRFAYGETVELSEQVHDFAYQSLLLAESLLRFVGFLSDVLLSFAKTKLSAMSDETRHSLYQELQGFAPSGRLVLLSAKSQLKAVFGLLIFSVNDFLLREDC
jgi:hypothetical protein